MRRLMNCTGVFDAAYLVDLMQRLDCDTIERRRPILLDSTVNASECHHIGPSRVHSKISFDWHQRSLIMAADGGIDCVELAQLGRHHVSQGPL